MSGLRHGALAPLRRAGGGHFTASLHNLLTPRGVLVRDGKAWAHFIDEAIDLFGEKTEVVFNTHHWPRWGKERINQYLRKEEGFL